MQTKTLLASIFELMDFNPAIVSSDMCLEEFRAKYLDSYLYLDGKPFYVSNISANSLSGVDRKVYSYHDIHELKNISLKPGLYLSIMGDTLFYVYKYPSKQFCKGVKFGQTHNMRTLAGKPTDTTLNISFAGYTYIFDRKVFIYDKQVGLVTNQEIVLEDNYKHLKQECEELWKQYKII